MCKEYLDFILGLVKEVAEIQLSYFRGSDLGTVTKSNVADVVTRADKQSEEIIARAILSRYPDHSILGEEGGDRGTPGGDYRWVVDPLDGTTNFSQGLPVFCISVALQYKGETIVGVVYAPYLDELFVGVKGGGAFMEYRGGGLKPIRVSDKRTLGPAVIGTGFPYDKAVEPDNNAENVARIVPYVRDLRRMGSAAYDICCVACGMLDGYWELGLHEWDVCAANLIVQEAGGMVHNFRYDRGISQIVGSREMVHEIRGYVK